MLQHEERSIPSCWTVLLQIQLLFAFQQSLGSFSKHMHVGENMLEFDICLQCASLRHLQNACIHVGVWHLSSVCISETFVLCNRYRFSLVRLLRIVLNHSTQWKWKITSYCQHLNGGPNFSTVVSQQYELCFAVVTYLFSEHEQIINISSNN